jgi:hypothetical protein
MFRVARRLTGPGDSVGLKSWNRYCGFRAGLELDAADNVVAGRVIAWNLG